MSTELPIRPVLPRNLTARADYMVAGNPMTARPESGVGNAHPGLEFDVRVLDRHFLPGLVFDFQYGAGARLVDLKPGENPALPSLTPDDLKTGIFLLLLKAKFGWAPEQDKVVSLASVDGYAVLRQVIDLEPGARTVVVGPLPTAQSDRDALARIEADLTAGVVSDTVVRGSSGELRYAVVTGTRTTFMTADGVIDPDLIPPGELTQNLCSPWQWDFADCYCYYWASSKPDIVVGITGDAQVLNFQRDRSLPEPSVPATTPAKWMAGNMSEADMILNWEKLPIVTSDREGVVPRKPEWPLIDSTKILTLDQIGDELCSLAGLEHALCVEYLFAKYSIDAPPRAPSRWRRKAFRRYQARSEVLSIAVDEMRHFRWVNEMLRLLKRPPVIARASVIGQDLRRNFALRTLQPDVLDQFIAIEAPSSIYNDDPQQLDGMYTRILVSLHRIDMPHEESLRFRLKQLVKTIIDEGDDHWVRFRRIKAHLAGQGSDTYLNKIAPLGTPPPEPWNLVQDLCDAHYGLLLELLYVTFRLGRMSRGEWLNLSHLAMFALDSAATFLVTNGYGPKFTLPDWPGGFPPMFANAAGGPGHVSHLHELISSGDVVEQMFAPGREILKKLPGRGTLAAFVRDQSEKLDIMRAAIGTRIADATVTGR